MPLTVSQSEGLTVITVTSNPTSKWPILCQLMGYLCYSPVCSVSRIETGKLKNIHTALGIVQMIVGIINIVVGTVISSLGYGFNMYLMSYGPFWIGAVLLSGMLVNIFSFALAITAVVLYSVDLASGHYRYCEEYRNDYYSSYDRYRTPTPEQSKDLEICLYYRNLYQMILGGLDITMIVLSLLQLGVTMSFCVLTGKSICKKEEEESVKEKPEMKKPLLEDFISVAA
ncbi:hypothetical protein DNTS_003583 [Danionella cerebrum]|uniref:Uncharacterized protein n=1 Tax=Danionella cerebrum TaxID=2873325 RepID=A0A553REG5_9TELE|nr:hypothetical protein DNTS_003583 [Danionella translucida]